VRNGSKFHAAQVKTAWGRRHQRRFALVDGDEVLASATQYDLAAVLDQRPARACGIGEMTQPPDRAGGHVRGCLATTYSTGVATSSDSINQRLLRARPSS
jgi:hypothetical protein